MQIFHCALAGGDRPCAPADCGRCLGKEKLHCHGSYARNADCSGEAKAVVVRFLCRRCGKTFGVIPAGMFPYRSLPVARFEQWMDLRFVVRTAAAEALDHTLDHTLDQALAGGGARPPPASEIEKGCLLRTLARMQSRISFLHGLLGQRMPLLSRNDVRGFWRALRKIGRLEDILDHLAAAFKTSLLADYRSLKPHWEREPVPAWGVAAPA